MLGSKYLLLFAVIALLFENILSIDHCTGPKAEWVVGRVAIGPIKRRIQLNAASCGDVMIFNLHPSANTSILLSL